MQEDTRLLLRECSSGCKMAIESMKQVMEYVDDEALRHLIDAFTQKHEAFEAEAARLLEEHGETEKSPGWVAGAFSHFSTDMKLLVHKNDTKEVAKIMADGCHMGIESLAGKVNEYANAGDSAKTLAKQIIQEEEDFMQDLKKYL